jgi:glutamyl-tRNA synthetase
VTTRTRFAPSPTGDLHLGGAWTALASWVVARRDGGQCVLRVEDLDPPRVVNGAEARFEEDLRWLGLDWDERVARQSERGSAYESAIAKMVAQGIVYPCDCSRAEIALVANAPHLGEESVYPGTCRDRDHSRNMKRPPSLRVRVPDEIVGYDDGVVGRVEQNLAREVGDFVLRRGDGVYAYQLAVTVDDAAAEITDVIRGSDLVASTPRQIWLMKTLGAAPPRYAHVPLVVATDGSRLEKRHAATSVRELRARGVSAARIIGRLAYGLGLVPRDVAATPYDVARGCTGRALDWRRVPWSAPTTW